MHMASIRVRYGFRWHSDKSYRTSRRRVWYVLSECHLNPYRTRMDAICIFSHEKPLNFKLNTNLKYQNPQCKSQSAIWHQIRTVLNIETWLWSARNQGSPSASPHINTWSPPTSRLRDLLALSYSPGSHCNPHSKLTGSAYKYTQIQILFAASSQQFKYVHIHI